MMSHDEQRALREAILQFGQAEINATLDARERSGQFDRELWKKCASFQFQSLTIPEALGGAGFDAVDAALAMEFLGFGCKDNGLILSLAAHLVAVAMPLQLYGTKEQRAKYFPGLANGSLIGAHALTEPESGSDAFAMRTTAVKQGNHYKINGTKSFITNAPVADVAIVFAITDANKKQFGGITGFIVDLNTKGIERSRPYEKMGLMTSPLGELIFNDVLVSENDAVGGIGGGAALFTHAMNWERILLFAAQVGTLQRIMEDTLRFVKTRSQFGKPIGKYQAVSHSIAEMRMDLEAGRLLIRNAATLVAGTRGLCVEASLAKLFVSEALEKHATRAMHLHGGFGYMKEGGIERDVRDAHAATIYSGTSEIQKELVAKWLGL